MVVHCVPVVSETRKYKPVADLATGPLGSLSVAQGAGRVVLLRRILQAPPWNSALLDALSASANRAKAHHHPRLLAVVDVDRKDTELVVATEYVEGVPLSLLLQRARQKRLRVPAAAALRIGEELARAILAAEELCARDPAPWVFGGLHPETIVISSGDDALIADLGLVGFEAALDSASSAAYRAPELGHTQATGSTAVFSIGVILWELLAGREAFDQSAASASLPAVRNKVIAGATPRLDQVVKGIPALLTEVVMQALRPDPGARFPTVKALSDALAAVQRDRGTGELVRFMTSLATDVLEAQRGSIVKSQVTVDSWRPTMHGLESQPPVVIPKAPRLMGLAAFVPAESSGESQTDSGRAVDSLLNVDVEVDVDAEPMRVEVPASAPLGGPRAPMGTAPLLLVHKSDVNNPVVDIASPQTAPAPTPHSAAPSTPGEVTASFDDDFEVPVRRRWGLVVFVLLMLSGAVAVGVLAFLKQQEAAQTPLAVPSALIPADTEVEAEDAATTEDASPDRSKEPIKRAPRSAGREVQAPSGPGASPIDGKSILEPGPDKPTPSAAPTGPSPGPNSGSDNPYADPQAPAPKPSVDPVLGY